MVPKPGLAFIFQSTLPRGSDHVVPVLVLIGLHFNPRSLAEATSGALCLAEIMDISIHAPSRERLHPWTRIAGVASISIHAPSRERLLFLFG